MMTEENFPQFTIPEIGPLELAARLQAEPGLVLLDVREPFEHTRARLNDPRVVYAPMSELAQRQLAALPAAAQDADVALVVFCHLGQRSAQVVFWLREIGWRNVVNLSGGIHAYASQVDRSIGFY